MKNNLILLSCGLLLAIALGQSAHAQTPDGETPANEGICDDLKADSVTKGLYGLCVAFCEAQDHASILDPITEEELEALADGIPSGQILANYNKKKAETDPPMPCIKEEEPCPCWTEEEFLATSERAFSGRNTNFCDDNWRDTGSFYYIYKSDRPRYRVFVAENSGDPLCSLWDNLGAPGGISRNVSITPEELGSCRDRIIARQEEFGLIPSATNSRQPYCLDSL